MKNKLNLKNDILRNIKAGLEKMELYEQDLILIENFIKTVKFDNNQKVCN